MYRILTIIVTYNGEKWVNKCFSSLRESTIPLDILVVDNGSTDNTVNSIKTNYPEVKLIESKENLGFGKANNVGLKQVVDNDYDFAFLLNQDAWIEPKTIEKLVEVSKNNKQLGVLSPIHFNGKGDALDRNFHFYLGHDFTPNFYSDLLLNKQLQFYISKFANAAAWLVTKECIKTIGGFDPLFNHYGEDDDYIFRLQESGLQLAIVPAAKIYHDRPQVGKMNEKFYDSKMLVKVLLEAKKGKLPNKFFVWRKIIIDYITLFFLYLGKNKGIKQNIKYDFLVLRFKDKVDCNLFQKL
ncbi:glycosyltransferase family 2 protein [Formosa sediminum]|uniref:Glycosyltransferase family 2 protein n=1 Tax=Formosa sediminum TaxID=2594004 RepID=A0A516GQ76_9FLAO|nr:glycosyltransferase family 2 protein [Formosa sediminum]QDO93685.1 glycosyltransferase family 2 protein [Formosa sediminum]